MKNGFIEWPNKALYRISDLRPKREKMRNDNKCVGQTRPYTEMSLKDQNWFLGAHFWSKSRF